MDREASTLSLVDLPAGFSRRGIDPVGETSNVPDIPLGTRRLVVSRPVPAAEGDIHGCPKPRAEEASQTQEVNQAEEVASAVDSRPRPRLDRGALNVINPDAAGIDVHSNMHMVCVPADRDANPVQQFGANTADLHEIAAWLKKCRVRTVSLESTGVYWIPLFELLQQHEESRRRRRKNTSRVATALRLAAPVGGQDDDSAGTVLPPDSQSDRETLGAVKATAHKLACLIYRMLKYGHEYVVQSMEEYEAKTKANMFKVLQRKAMAMGFQLTLIPTQ